MLSQQAQNLVTLTAVLRGETDIPNPQRGYGGYQPALLKVVTKELKRLATGIISGRPAPLRNVMEEEPLDPLYHYVNDEDDDVYYEHYINGHSRVMYGTGEEEDHKQDYPYRTGVCEYINWFSDGEDARYESN